MDESYKYGILVFVVLILFSKSIFGQSDTVKYFFEGHTYQWHTAGDKVDERLEKMDFSEYDGIWLGGDVCSESLLEYSTLEYIHGLFNLQHPNTHWAMGNHDSRNGNWNWLEELTGRKTYYTSHYKGISYMVLNTTLTPYNCEQLNDQYRIITTLCDTIQNSSHLIFLVHHCLWENVPDMPHPYAFAQSNLKYFSFTCSNHDATFLNDIYPRLIEVGNRGVEVILIMGDMGSRRFETTNRNGITFMGTGLNRSYYKDPVERENSDRDWFIEFKHVPEKNWLDWKFHDLDSTMKAMRFH